MSEAEKTVAPDKTAVTTSGNEPRPGESIKLQSSDKPKDLGAMFRRSGMFAKVKSEVGRTSDPTDNTKAEKSAKAEPSKKELRAAAKAKAEASDTSDTPSDVDPDDESEGDASEPSDTAEAKPDDDKETVEAEEKRKRQSREVRAQMAEIKRRERKIVHRTREQTERENDIVAGAADVRRSRELLTSDPLKWAESHGVDVTELVAKVIEKRAQSEGESNAKASVLKNLKGSRELMEKEPEKFLELVAAAIEQAGSGATEKVSPAMQKRLDELEAKLAAKDKSNVDEQELRTKAEQQIAKQKADTIAHTIDAHDEIDPEKYPLLSRLDAEKVAERAWAYAVRVFNTEKKNLSIEQIFDAFEARERRQQAKDKTTPEQSGGGTSGRASNGKPGSGTEDAKPASLTTRTRKPATNGVGNHALFTSRLGGLFRQVSG